MVAPCHVRPLASSEDSAFLPLSDDMSLPAAFLAGELTRAFRTGDGDVCCVFVTDEFRGVLGLVQN